MSIDLLRTPDMAFIEYPVSLFAETPETDDQGENAQGDEGWEASCEWLTARRVLQDMNAFEIGWMGARVEKRYGESSRTQWAIAGGYRPGTIGRYVAVARAFTPSEVRQITAVAPNFSFKHAEFLASFKLASDWEDVMDIAEQVGQFLWSAETMRKYLKGDEEGDDDQYGKPFGASGTLTFDEVWRDTEYGRVKVPAMILLIDPNSINTVMEKAALRGFDEGPVDVIVKRPRDDE